MMTPSLLGIALLCLSAMPKSCGGEDYSHWYQTGRYCIRYFSTPLSFSDAESNDFIWTDGSSWNFENWVPGQPDDASNVESCVEMNWGNLGEWNDDQCMKRKPFICAFKRHEWQREPDN